MKAQRVGGRSVVVLAIGVMIILAGLAGYFFKQYSDLKNNPQAATQETTKRVAEKVGKLYALPQDEQPTIAAVKDKQKLKDQPFFKNAQNGDQILIYTKAKIALIYRETTNKIINVGPVAISDTKHQQTQSKVSVTVRNGTNKTGQAAAIGSTLASKLPDVVNIDPNYSDAKIKNATKTTVVDMSGTHQSAAQQIATALNGVVSALPSGEAKSNTDILVITGP